MAEILLPEMVAQQDGVGVAFEPEPFNTQWLLTLNVSRILEHEGLEVTVTGSPDREHWLPVARFPRKFHCGTYSHWVDLAKHPGVRYVRAEWKMTRWGLSESSVLCGFSVTATPQKALYAGAL